MFDFCPFPQSFAGLYELGRAPSSGHMLKCILNDTASALRSEITEEIQVKFCHVFWGVSVVSGM